MFKKTFVTIIFALSSSVNAAIIDLGNITRDTSTSLEWLDVTESLDLSYNQVISEMYIGGLYEGWRYATPKELDQLITNFGYIPVDTNCHGPTIHCDFGLQGDNPIIENMINTLGDTYDAFSDLTLAQYDASPSGAAHTTGLLAKRPINTELIQYAEIYDGEYIERFGFIRRDFNDKVLTTSGVISSDDHNGAIGSFLVRESITAVPIPSAVWLFITGLIGVISLATKKHNK